MNRSLAYTLAGALLTGVAVWVLRTRSQGEPVGSLDPLDEVSRMMSQTRKRVKEIQDNFEQFQHVLTQVTALESS